MPKGLGRPYIEMHKQAYWRGVNKLFANRYVLSGSDPDASDCAALVGAIHSIENQLFPTVVAGQGVGFVRGAVYASAGGAPIYATNYNVTEAPLTATGFAGPAVAYTALQFVGTLENCLDVRMLLQGLSSTGKPVFVRKYYRGILNANEALGDTAIPAADLTKVNAAVAPFFSGLASTGRQVIGVSGNVPNSAPTAQQFIGNHQVPRGRKKKKASTSVAGDVSSFILKVAESAGPAIAKGVAGLAEDL